MHHWAVHQPNLADGLHKLKLLNLSWYVTLTSTTEQTENVLPDPNQSHLRFLANAQRASQRLVVLTSS